MNCRWKRHIAGLIREIAIYLKMGFSTSLQGQASHEALLARQDAEIKLLETMRRCLTSKIKSDRDYASTISSLAVQGKKIERTEDLVGSLVVQVNFFILYIIRSKNCAARLASKIEGFFVKIDNRAGEI